MSYIWQNEREHLAFAEFVVSSGLSYRDAAASWTKEHQLAEPVTFHQARRAKRSIDKIRARVGALVEEIKPRHTIAPLRTSNTPRETNRTVVFDIEVTDFNTEGEIGRFICCSFLPLDSDTIKTIQINYDEYGDDRRALQEVAHELARYRFHVGHNIAAFDYNWINSRLMYHGFDTLDSALYFDTYQVAKSLSIKTRKGLGNLLDYFGLEGEKTTIYRTSWSDVFSPYQERFEKRMKDIIYHCEQDVFGNRNLYDVLHWYSLRNGRANPWKISKTRGTAWFKK